MAQHEGDLTLTREETIALNEGRAWLYKGRVIPIISGAEDPPPDPDPTPDPDPAQRPEWLPDNFTSPEAFAEAYRNSQAKISEQGNELSQMREQMEEMTSLFAQQAPQQQPQFDPSQHPLIRGLQQAMDEGDAIGFAVGMQQLMQLQQPQATTETGGRELDPYLVQQMHQSIASKYDDSLSARAYELMESDPVIAPQIQALSDNPQATIGDLAPLVDHAYKMAAFEGGQTVQAQSLAQKQAEEEAARQRKIEAETMTGSGPTRVASQSEQEKTREAIWGADTGEFRVGRVA